MRNVGDDAGDFAIDSLAHCVCVIAPSVKDQEKKEGKKADA